MTQIKLDVKCSADIWYCIVCYHELDSEKIRSVSQLTTIELQRDAFEIISAPSKIVCEKGNTREEAIYNAFRGNTNDES